MTDLTKGHTLLFRFSLIQLIGAGGMGQVWRALDLDLQEEIAVKILAPTLCRRPERMELLEVECRKARQLNHPHIVRMYDFHRSDDLAFVSMEYVNGEDLMAIRRRLGRLHPTEALQRIQPVVSALEYAHRTGIVHRGIKPSNVLTDRNDLTRLTDFGISAGFHHEWGSHPVPGGLPFTMSPQQLQGSPPHPSDDMYALGTLLYELLTGRPPFYPDITFEKIRKKDPPSVNEQLEQQGSDDRIPEELDRTIAAMLAKDRKDRPRGMETLHDRFQGILDRTLPPREALYLSHRTRDTAAKMRSSRADPVPAAQKSLRKRFLWTVSALVVMIAALVSGGTLLIRHLARSPVMLESVSSEGVQNDSSQYDLEAGARSKEVTQVPDGPLEHSNDPLKHQAEEHLELFVMLKKELDHMGASRWANEAYTAIVQLAQKGDDSFVQQDYPSASRAYETAATQAENLRGSSIHVLERMLEEGEAALVKNHSHLAEEKFIIALLIDPANETAQRGLKQSETLQRVESLLQSGTRHEAEGNLAFALADYQEAFRLDPSSVEAEDATHRVKNRIADGQFQDLMSLGFSALHDGRPKQAQELFQQAKSFRPDSAAVRDAMVQANQAVRLARIAELKANAAAAEQAEDWDQALTNYQEVLGIDPAIQFAVRGKERCLKQIEVIKGIRFYLEKPHLLESKGHIQDAGRILDRASSLEPRGHRLSAEMLELDRLIRRAKTLVKVTLLSDNQTKVSVYHVGQLGSFHSLTLDLRPGTYTAVGSRTGYKDVRREIEVTADAEPAPIIIQCEDRI